MATRIQENKGQTRLFFNLVNRELARLTCQINRWRSHHQVQSFLRNKITSLEEAKIISTGQSAQIECGQHEQNDDRASAGHKRHHISIEIRARRRLMIVVECCGCEAVQSEIRIEIVAEKEESGMIGCGMAYV